jgi:type VI secretion system protein ImpE
MTAHELLEVGQLTGAIDALSDTLRHNPQDPVAHVSLFTLVCLSGLWDRASNQLEAWESLSGRQVDGLDPARCKVLLEAESARQRFFAEGALPQTFGPPGASVTLTIEISQLVAAGRADEAGRLIERFEDERPPRRGRLDGQPFDDFRDAEDFMAPVLEVLAPGGYFWVGWDDVQFLDVVAPTSLLDLLWAPARLGLKAGVIGSVVLPGLYPRTWDHPDELVRLGRRNDWIELGAGLVRGTGAKVFDVGGRSKALLELQNLVFDNPSGFTIARSPEADS